jgi:paraquat-inducible protein B
MSKRANPTLIGGFVVGAIALAIVAVIVIGGGRFFTETRPGVIYFQESVAGLDVGAQVTFNGVTVGSVTGIGLVYRVQEGAVSIPVSVTLFPQNITFAEGDMAQFDVKMLARDGMRAQLGLSSILTGRLVINLVMAPDTSIRLRAADRETFLTPAGVVEIPAIRSQMQEVRTAVETVLTGFAAAEPEVLLQEITASVRAIRDFVTMPELGEIVQRTNETIGQVQALVEDVDGRFTPLLAGAEEALTALRTLANEGELTLSETRGLIAETKPALASMQSALEEAERALSAAASSIEPGSALHHQATLALREATSAARALRTLANTIERNPNALLFGRQAR